MLLEGEGPFSVGKCDVVFYRPRRLFRRVRYFACVVPLQTSAQVAGDSDVVMFGVLYAAQDIHIGHETLAGIVARQAVAREGNARLRPLGFGAAAFAEEAERRLVGLGGLEPPTSPLSGARASHLSYRPFEERRKDFSTAPQATHTGPTAQNPPLAWARCPPAPP